MVSEKYKLRQYIVSKFSKPPINWPREMKLAGLLVNWESDKKFWEWLTFNFTLNSLAWFLRADGKDTLVKKRNIFNFEITKAPIKYKEEEKKDLNTDYILEKPTAKRKVMDLF